MTDPEALEIYLVRHAEPEYSGADSDRPLTERGRRQAARAAKLISDSGATELRSAPHRRCRETAEIIGRRLGLPVQVDQALHIARRFDLPSGGPIAIWVAHSNNIPGALRRAGIDCHACGHASIWHVRISPESASESSYTPVDELV